MNPVTVYTDDGPKQLKCFYRCGVWCTVEDYGVHTGTTYYGVVHEPTGSVFADTEGVWKTTSDAAINLCRVLGQWPNYGEDLQFGATFDAPPEMLKAVMEMAA